MLRRFSCPSISFIPCFDDKGLEQSFRRFQSGIIRSQCRIALLLYILAQVALLVCMCTYHGPSYAKRHELVLRVTIALVCFVGWISSYHKMGAKHSFLLLRLTYTVIGALLLFMHTLVSVSYHSRGLIEESAYLFYVGIWSTGDSMFYIFMCFNCSGMLLGDTVSICGLYTILTTTLPFIIFQHILRNYSILGLRIVLLPLLYAYEILYTKHIESESRSRYLSQLRIGADLCRQDTLIQSILPLHISEALKQGYTEKLASFHSSVTILFCHIVGFEEHSLKSKSHDIVELIQQMVGVMDHIVEQTGAYKVESIADVYMACAGCPVESNEHAVTMARLALSFLVTAKNSCWAWPDGSKVELQIGLHTGPVTAGVIGTKSYSYHLFGDTVNTASRMCSNSLPGRVLLSPSTFQSLQEYSEVFDFDKRGQVVVKGKGRMDLYWLRGYQPDMEEEFSISSSRISRRVYTDRYAKLHKAKTSRIMVNPYTLRFCTTTLDDSVKPEVSFKLSPMNWFFSNLAMSTTMQFSVDQSSSVPAQDPVPQCSTEIEEFQPYNLDTVEGKYHQLSVVQEIEKSYQEDFDRQSIPQQWNIIIVTILSTFAYFVHKTVNQESSFGNLINCGMWSVIAYLAQRWERYYIYEQRIIFFALPLNLIIFRVINRSESDGVKGPAFQIWWILSTCLFFRLRFHYVALCGLMIIFIPVMLFACGVTEKDDNGPDWTSLLFSLSTLFIAMWIRYLQERAERTEYIGYYIMKDEMFKSQYLLSNMLPSPEHAMKLLHGKTVTEELKDVTLLYSDMKGFTQLSAKLHPLDLCALLNDIYSLFDRHLNYFGLYKVDIIGDAFVVVGGLPCHSQKRNSAMNCVLFAFHMLQDMKSVCEKYGVEIELRVGIHSGNAVGSVVSLNKPRYLLWGAAAVTANRMESSGVPGKVHISQSTMDKISPVELDFLNISYSKREGDNENSYLLRCADISGFYHDDGVAGNDEEMTDNFSLVASALKKIKRISGGKKVVVCALSEEEAQISNDTIRMTTSRSLLSDSAERFIRQRHSPKIAPVGYFPPNELELCDIESNDMHDTMVLSSNETSTSIVSVDLYTSNGQNTPSQLPIGRYTSGPTVELNAQHI